MFELFSCILANVFDVRPEESLRDDVHKDKVHYVTCETETKRGLSPGKEEQWKAILEINKGLDAEMGESPPLDEKVLQAALGGSATTMSMS